MGYRLGVDLGTTFTAAVVHRPEDGVAPTTVRLGDRGAAIPSVLFLGEDGTVLLGEAAERRALSEPDRVVRRFKRRIGDETPLLVGPGGDGLTAHAIAGRMIALVADRVAEQEGGAPDAVAVTVPAAWGDHKKTLLAAALLREGLLGVTLVSEPTAVALAYARTGRLSAGSTVAVYDFGGGTFDAALLRAHSDTRFTVLGTPSGLPDLGGIDFDDAVLAYVLGTAGPQTPGVDSDDPLHVHAMARLRRECVDAKEALSADSAVTVPVLLGGAQASVRLTRGDFEAMIAGAVEETCTALEATLVSAGLTRNNLDRILLAGGSSRIPLVTQLLSARYPGVTLERDIDPKLAVAIGAVLALEQSRSGGGRHAAPRSTAPGEIAKPARPAVTVESFDQELDGARTAPVVTQRRKTPAVLMTAAGVVLLGGFGLTQFGGLDIRDALPASALPEAHASTEDTAGGLEIEAVNDAKADAKTGKKKPASPQEASGLPEASAAATGADTSVSSDNSAGTARGRTEGSAPTRSAESSGPAASSDVTKADGKSAATRSKRASGDQASPERTEGQEGAAAPGPGDAAAGALTAAPGGATAVPQEPATAESGAAKAEPAEAETTKAETAKAEPAKAETTKAEPAKAEPAKVGPPKAGPPKAEVEDTSADSGSVEFKNGGPAKDAP